MKLAETSYESLGFFRATENSVAFVLGFPKYLHRVALDFSMAFFIFQSAPAGA